jgi:RNA-dependent RNA polymerase
VWLRPSQVKIQQTPKFQQNPAYRVIDTLRASHMESSVKISREMIINLSENGVSSAIFSDLLGQSLQDTVLSLLDWDGKNAMFRLWAAVSREGNVMASRIARESSWTARASGTQLYDQEDDLYDDESSSLDSVAWWGDEISGCPSSLEETVMAFLDSGFHPSSNAILSEKLCIVTKKAVKSCISKSRIKVPMSCRALIVPGIFYLFFGFV